MLRRLMACLAFLCLTGPALAQNDVQLTPRVPYAKMVTEKIVLPDQDEVKLIVKFHDNVLARATADGRITSLANQDMNNVLALAAGTGVTFKKVINHPLNKLATLQSRASSLSKRGQPDLGGIMYVVGDRAKLLQVARALNDMPNVEYVEFEPEWLPQQSQSFIQDGSKGGDPLAGHGGPGCGDPDSTDCDTVDMKNPFCNDVLCCEAVCQADPTCCEDVWDDTCVILADTLCADLPVMECGAEVTLDCFIGHPPYHVACDDLDCCEIVCTLDPGCCEDWWDDRCAVIALIKCGGPICAAAEQDCFVEHVDPQEAGCNEVACCSDVCGFDAFCCVSNWDYLCAAEALLVCEGGDANLCGVDGVGDCFDSDDNNGPYCDDAECCAIVCAADPYCCDFAGDWDELCADLAFATCDDGPAHLCDEDAKDCFQPHPPFWTNCNDPACCAEVCAIDSFCCAVVWDSICAGEASQICRSGDVCANEFAGRCLDDHPGIGCSNEACCDIVCEIAPVCCNDEWDVACAGIASQFCDFDSETPTPDFTALQGYKTIESYFDEDGNNPPIRHEGHSEGLAYPAPSFAGYTGEGFDLPGLWDYGEFILDFGKGETNLTRGKGARIGIIEHSAWVDHEDLINKVISEPGQTIIHGEGGFLSSNHGTATLGIAVAEDNGIGITGMAPEAQGYFFPIVSLEEAGGRLISAMTSALLVFEHGDVLSYSIGPAGIGTLDSSFTTNLMLRISSDLGIISCLAAGNDCGNLDDNDGPGNALPDSGAITVGAGTPGFPFCRLGFSNHGNCGGRVHCQAWGSNVVTTGYGTLFNPGAELPQAGDPRRQYANEFGGTSAAAPIIAGLAANLQGIAKMFYGIPLMPEQIRGVMGGTGFLQCFTLPCGDLAGQVELLNCLGDGDPDEDPNSIGLFPLAVEGAEAIITAPWFNGAPFLDGIEILRGHLVSGNVFSIKQSDNNRLVIKSQFTQPNDNQGLGINYLGSGQITDLLVHAHISGEGHQFINLIITDESSQSDVAVTCEDFGVPSANGLKFFEMWNWITQEWDFVLFGASTRDDCSLFIGGPPVVPAAARFVKQDDGKMQLRIWSLSLGGNFGGFGGGGVPPYLIRHDYINIQTSGLGGGDDPTPP